MKSGTTAQASPHAVLAVVVVYERGLAEVAPWPALCTAMAVPRSDDGLVLDHVLVYDNSATASVATRDLPLWASCVHDASNGGTAAAYRRALQQAQGIGASWLLLLDDDTTPPADLLPLATAALARAGTRRVVAAVLPRVRHGREAVSPSHITWTGSIRPLALDEPPDAARALTGIASGALVHVASCVALGPPPAGLWLDYVDHWMFTGLRRQGHAVLVSEALLEHDLSISQPRRLSAARLASVLQGEEIFARTLPWPARLMRPLRLLWRALRVSPLRLRQRADIVNHLLRASLWRRG